MSDKSMCTFRISVLLKSCGLSKSDLLNMFVEQMRDVRSSEEELISPHAVRDVSDLVQQ